nr:MAG TPA: hypothetical protein [Caudoviricetes sp.]
MPGRAFSKIPFTFQPFIGASLTLSSSIFPNLTLSSSVSSFHLL